MAQKCTVCKHKKREEIDKAILSGTTLRELAKKYFVSPAALHRHKKHIAMNLIQAETVQEVIRADNLLDEVGRLLQKANHLLRQAEEAGDLRTALSGVREVRATMELMAKMILVGEQQKAEQQGHKISNIENALLELDQEVI